MVKKVTTVIDNFDTICLEDSGKVKFLKRCDYKFVTNIEKLCEILDYIKEDYFVMTIKEAKIQDYRTTYFDTDDNYFYICHHNQRNNRFKVRKREYVNTGEHFLEIKRKTLNGRTTKKRINSFTETDEQVTIDENVFIKKYIQNELEGLSPKLDTNFKRLTLVSKKFDERVTVDLGLKFKEYENNTDYQTNNLCIIEVKCNKMCGKTSILNALKKFNVRLGGFSKYCIGRAVLNKTLKQNNFKVKVNLLRKFS
ncbi:MAG: VTC domain-containing protein [Bacteroidetes bacterium]|nr:VTC domain-containing protein [Bacteroidota bacterium]